MHLSTTRIYALRALGENSVRALGANWHLPKRKIDGFSKLQSRYLAKNFGLRSLKALNEFCACVLHVSTFFRNCDSRFFCAAGRLIVIAAASALNAIAIPQQLSTRKLGRNSTPASRAASNRTCSSWRRRGHSPKLLLHANVSSHQREISEVSSAPGRFPSHLRQQCHLQVLQPD